ncbi:MAG: histidine phosphatase family protein [Pirellulaceae bacterium]
MKTALILRHAKSNWDNIHQSDHERPLNKRGQRDAPRLGELILREQLTPDTIVSSTAQRARETAEAVAAASQFAGEILYDDNLYLAPPQVYLDLLQAMPDEHQRVLLIGHNPGLEELVSRLTEQPTTMPTAALAHLQWELDSWQDLAEASTARLRDFWIPRELA